MTSCKVSKRVGAYALGICKEYAPRHISISADTVGESDCHTHFLHLVFHPYISATYGWSERVILRNCASSTSPL